MFSHTVMVENNGSQSKRRVYKFKLKKGARHFADQFQGRIIHQDETGNYIIIL